MKFKFFAPFLLASVALTTLNANAAFAVPSAYSSFDWDTYRVQISHVGNSEGSITWNEASRSSSVSANDGTYNSFSSGDWTTSLNADEGIAHGFANQYTLQSTFTGIPSGLNAYADARRYGEFTLAANTIVTFTVNANTYINLPTPTGGDAYSWATFNVEGTGIFGTLEQHGTAEKISWAHDGVGTNSGTLQVSFMNLSNSEITGKLTAYTAVNSYGAVAAVPEPETYAMLLAGLGLMGLIARRRMK